MRLSDRALFERFRKENTPRETEIDVQQRKSSSFIARPSKRQKMNCIREQSNISVQLFAIRW